MPRVEVCTPDPNIIYRLCFDPTLIKTPEFLQIKAIFMGKKPHSYIVEQCFYI